MKKMILLVVLTSFLMVGCTETGKARARDIRKRTDQNEELHALLVEEKKIDLSEYKALKPVRMATKENLILTGEIAGIVLVIVLTGAGSYYIIGFAIAKVKQANLMLVPLDKATRQYPLIVGNGSQAHNPNTLSNSDLLIDRLPYPDALRGSHSVQLLGVRFESYKEYEDQKLLQG